MAYNDIISLNVGGARFETTRQTLIGDHDSMLAKMFNSDSKLSPAQIKDGAYFIDRDPDMFKYILKYLRSGNLVVEIPINDLLELKVEAEYFQLIDLQKIIIKHLDENKDLNLRDTVFVIVEGKASALKHCIKERIAPNGDFLARPNEVLCDNKRSKCGCYRSHETTLDDLVERILRRLENNRVCDKGPSREDGELYEDSVAAWRIGLLPGWTKWFY